MFRKVKRIESLVCQKDFKNFVLLWEGKSDEHYKRVRTVKAKIELSRSKISKLVIYSGGKLDEGKTLGCLFQKGFWGWDCINSQKALDNLQKGPLDRTSDISCWLSIFFPSP